jgi:hypothetical protein
LKAGEASDKNFFIHDCHYTNINKNILFTVLRNKRGTRSSEITDIQCGEPPEKKEGEDTRNNGVDSKIPQFQIVIAA